MTTTYLVLAFIQAWPHPYGPSLQEIAAAVCLSHPSSVVRHLNRLEGWGLISRDMGKARTIALTEEGRKFKIPVSITG